MNDLPRQILCELIVKHGASLCEEPRRCEGLLRDLCPGARREVHVLVGALEARVATELLNASAAVPLEMTLTRLIKRLEEDQSLRYEMARWAVETWALALGRASAADLARLSGPSTAEPAALPPVPAPGALAPIPAPAALPPLPIPAGRAGKPARKRLVKRARKRKKSKLAVTFRWLILLGAVGVGWWYLRENPERERQLRGQLERLWADVGKWREEWPGQRADPSRRVSFTNSLGMKFLPLPGTGVSMSIWETRVRDYAAYAAENLGLDTGWRGCEYEGCKQKPEHPVVNVSWERAQGFCRWLSQKEGKTYRLPTDHEWSLAVGIGQREASTASPQSKNKNITGIYPWGNQWPPAEGAGNYRALDGYSDGNLFTAKVGSYAPNKLGYYDLGGNVWEWCEDWYNASQKYRVLRGASWSNYDQVNLLSSYRDFFSPASRYNYVGFRVVMVGP